MTFFIPSGKSLRWALPLLLLTACTDSNTSNTTHNKTVVQGEQPDILVQNMDTIVQPGDDFFQYANGGWIKGTPIPADETNYGIAQLVMEDLYTRKKTINEESVKADDPNDIQRKIGDFYTAANDTVAIEKGGIEPLREALTKINGIATPADVMMVSAYLHQMGVGVFFGEGAGQDAMNSAKMAYYLMQGGLGMPNRDYYLKTDARTSGIRTAYEGYIAQLLAASGTQDTAATRQRAKAVLALETKLAKISRSVEALRDPYANYNKMTVAGLQKTTPRINWQTTISGIGAANVDTVIVGQPEFYKALDGIVGSEPVAVLKDYLTFHTISDFAPYLTTALGDARFNFYGKAIRGAEAQRPRWKRVLDAQEDAMGEMVGQLFAEQYFDKNAKARYSDMVEKVREAYKVRIQKLDWMTDSTKAKALDKLARMTKKVGYPDKWKDFSAMQIGKKSYAENMMAAHRWWNNYSLSKLGKPVDRTEWDMTPQTYNAYYNPSNNEIVLPAGIFTVPGRMDASLDDGLVYGYAAASTIGHEITHGFDDEGRQYDADGNLKSWWTKKDEEEFKKRADVLANQFSNIVALDSTRINGRMTLGENLADLGGLLLGVDAFKMTQTYKENKPISGLYPMQRFFLGYSLGWLYQIRDAELANRLITDVHSPAKWRVNGPLPNVPEFYTAFKIQPGQKMYLPDSARVKLW
ncbi:MAG: M13 family peptidase [Sphingobacteriales bacterium]|nr:MAG: M13 family peptidase [Sphingobacteriales bacterium]